ncbi:hypothetical protein DLH72_01280 [Candidatus Gracilibacteria bacterium]|nr:MAG: hypothetical protein DLH72_01280 [Candidatus Gracilibacteria bacterium]
MKILSLFDGMSCGYLALKNLGVEVAYYASEIDKYAISISKKNHKDIIHLGDILDWESWKLPKIDMIIGGSPCQGFSNAGKGLNFEDERSRLFFTFVDILEKYKPKFFIFENVKMKKEWENIISEYLGITPVLINSSLVSAQNRERLYWVGELGEDGEYKKINIPIPEDRDIFLQDILEKNINQKYYKNFDNIIIDRSEDFFKIKNATKKGYILAYDGDGVDLSFPNSSTKRGRVKKGKSGTLTTYPFQGVIDRDRIRQLTPIEYERLQTLPDNYTEGVSDNQRYKMIGNAWTVEVIMHIISIIGKK